MTELTVISRAEVETLLTMPICIGAMDTAMRALSAGAVVAPQRSFAPLGPDEGAVALMPACSEALPIFALKTMSLLPGNPAKGLPAIQGFIAAFDRDGGAPVALVDGMSVTAIRTAAASGLAVRELSRSDVRSHGVLGTGAQARTHARAVLAARPDITVTRIWGRSEDKAKALAESLRGALACEVEAVSLSDAVGCDVVSAVTGAAEPLIERSMVRDGAHINLVGSHSPEQREADARTIAAARVYVDHAPAAMQEAGDILLAIADGEIEPTHVIGEIGQVLSGERPGRTAADDITVYKSVGHAAQDLFAVATVIEAARASGAGSTVEL